MGKKKILVVDDETNIRVILKAILEREGFEVEMAEDGYIALQKARLFKPDLVISDLRMPNMNGFELLSVLRTRFPQIPTIAISGEFLTNEMDGLLIANAFFQKGSYSIEKMLATIIDLLEKPVAVPQLRRVSPLWTPVGDSPVMLTCAHCLRSSPIELCSQDGMPREADCIFCGQHLTIEVAAVGIASSN